MKRDWSSASEAQKRMARKFSDASTTMSVSQAMKYLDECFQLAKGDLTGEEFTRKTGHQPHDIRF